MFFKLLVSCILLVLLVKKGECQATSCAAVTCLTGSNCVIDPITNEAKCVAVTRACNLFCIQGSKCIIDQVTNQAKCVPIENPCNLVDCQPGRTCRVDPLTNEPVCVPAAVCPTSPTGIITTCDVRCFGDDSCPLDEKCCNFGCRVLCRKSCRPAVCPTNCRFGTKKNVDSKGCETCVCNNDPCVAVKCSAGYECRVNSRGQAGCYKIGHCPPRGIVNCFPYNSYQHQCTFDNNCPQQQKCCRNPCRRQCVEPCITQISQCKCDIGVPVLIATGPGNCKRCSCENPCQFANCPGRCEVKQVVCVRAPCRPVAECLPNRCRTGVELPNVFCGRGPNRVKCPSNYNCFISPVDAFAVCCPDKDPCKSACKTGERCVLQDVQCLVPPCAPVPKCLPECPLYKCAANACLNGYAYDKNGCRTCQCYNE